MRIKHALRLSVGICTLAACGGERTGEADSAAMADTTSMPAMPGMGAMSDSALARMESHMAMMDTASAATMRSMMPMHRQSADSMLTAMDDEMRRVTFADSAAWRATMDSVRQDMTRMEQMSDADLRTFMPQHRARMMRLMQMYRSGRQGAPR